VIEVILASAVLCFADACYPALVGRDTPTGEFRLRLLSTPQRAYRGDVLAFHEDRAGIYAVHRPPSERRRNILMGAPERGRRYVTDGCVNVDDAVYDRLRSCCDGQRIIIR
jgi:hypothetical protein